MSIRVQYYFLVNRNRHGLLVGELKLYHSQCHLYFRMSVGQFEALFQAQMLEPILRRQSSNYWEAVDPEQCLTVCLRWWTLLLPRRVDMTFAWQKSAVTFCRCVWAAAKTACRNQQNTKGKNDKLHLELMQKYATNPISIGRKKQTIWTFDTFGG